MPSSHPILKRARTTQPAPTATVHFSTALTRAFTHSGRDYDRSPIVVSPNACALPARGCPGRTYYDAHPPRRSGTPKPPQALRGHLHPRALAAQEHDDADDDDEDDGEVERTPTRTSPYIALPVPPPIPQPPVAAAPHSNNFYPYPLPQSYYPGNPPALVPDLSSESDESDGFASPPPEPASVPVYAGAKYPPSAYAAYPYPYPSSNNNTSPKPHNTAYPPQYSPSYAIPVPPSPYPHPSYPHSPHSPQNQNTVRDRRPRRPTLYPGPQLEDGDGYEEEDLPAPFSHAASFNSSQSAAAARGSPPRERRRPRSRERERSVRSGGGAGSPTAASFAAQGAGSPPRRDKDGVKPHREKREKKEKGVAALCRTLKGASFRDGAEGDGCLGGF